MVVDSSAILEVLLNRARASDIRERLQSEPVNAPHLIDVEVAHVLRRYAFLRTIDDMEARAAIENFRQLTIDRHPHEHLLEMMWTLRENFTAYDAAYVALTVLLQTTLITADVRLARAAESLLPVEVFA